MQHHVEALVAAAIAVLIVAFFLHLAAKLLTPKPKYVQSILVAVLAGLLGGILIVFVDPAWLGRILAVLGFLAVAAGVYRIGYFKALVLGFVAWVLFVVVQLLIEFVVRAVRA